MHSEVAKEHRLLGSEIFELESTFQQFPPV